jgi:uncharacterized protein (TIGR00661 family)
MNPATSSIPNNSRRFRVCYSVQTTGLGHWVPYRALGTALMDRGYELITFTSGPELPVFFYPVSLKHYHLRGPTLIIRGSRLNYIKTFFYNLLRIPLFFLNLFKFAKFIEKEKPDLIIEDYEPFTSNYLRFWKPDIASFSVDHQSTFISPMFPHRNIGFLLKTITRIFTFARFRLCSSFSDYGSRGGFVSLPPILRREVLEQSASDDGSILVYHSTAQDSDKERLKKACPKNWKFIFYGYKAEEFENISFRPKGEGFLEDLAKCHLYVTNCGFFSVCEALVLGKKVICRPIEGHAEQEWNAKLLKAFANVRVETQVDYGNLKIDQIPEADPVQTAWLRRGLESALKHISEIFTKKLSECPQSNG